MSFEARQVAEGLSNWAKSYSVLAYDASVCPRHRKNRAEYARLLMAAAAFVLREGQVQPMQQAAE